MPEKGSRELSQAVFDTLLYSDVFDYPLKASEIHLYLSGRAATFEEVCQTLNSDPRFGREGQFFTLKGREKIVQLREKRELRSQKLLPHAMRYGRIMGLLPFVRMVALTGSLAVHNVLSNEDFDYMLVTKAGHLWTARAFVLLFGRLTRLAGHTLCPNVLVAENRLEWSQHDLYSARDLCQMIPITGMAVYRNLMEKNDWVKAYLPNAYGEAFLAKQEKRRSHMFRRLIEFLLQGSLGDRFEQWEMNRKIERFTSQEGFGEETIFNASICQGNFDHHRGWTWQELGKRADIFNREDSGEENSLEKRRL